MAAENGSYMVGGGANLHLLNDRLRVKLGAANADIHYRFYGIGNEQGDSGIGIDMLQNARLYMASGTWRVWKKLYLGLGFVGGSVETRLRINLPVTPVFDPEFRTDIGAYTIPMEIDSRDHEQFPCVGWLVTAKTSLYRESAGSNFDAEIFKFSANHYWPMREQDVLASRIVIKATSDNVPFFLLSSFGGSTDLRGYPSGRYRDRMMVAMQTEFRWQVADRWIMTGFAGVGEVAESFSDFGRNFLPAAGIGIRYVLSEKHRVGLSTDLAVGNDGVEFYFGVGEAF
ncbi:MAG: BamA/TamA family outer membrane protein [Proteobacteria bacterium]|nr:BamA/TamA family outer membrane protein [Pseudomonadota bacterium]